MGSLYGKRASVSTLLAHAYALKKRGYYTAAKGLLAQALDSHPQHAELQALYKRIELLQKVKGPEALTD